MTREMVSIDVLDRLLKAHLEPIQNDIREFKGVLPRIVALEQENIRRLTERKTLRTLAAVTWGLFGGLALKGVELVWSYVTQA